MNTPICDFVRRYSERNALRLHMPGHKGCGPLSIEHLDITEIIGADSLYEASGIIRESEENAGCLFGCNTFFSTEGSSQCIRAMLYLAALHARSRGKTPHIAAGRNAHKTFLSAAALLDLDVTWICPSEQTSYLSCNPDAAYIDALLSSAEQPTAVYLTSPDYLGNLADIRSIAKVCHKHDVLLLVDNAHGAYLHFLQPSQHPIDLGADLCCDSAHKTLPVLTGGAYLHIAGRAPQQLCKQAKNALALFGSTSPSYLILQSLDAANVYLADGYAEKLNAFLPHIAELKEKLSAYGYHIYGSEPLKLTIRPKTFGYDGNQLAAILSESNIICEFSDPDHLVLMLTPEIGTDALKKLEDVLLSLPQKSPITNAPPVFHVPEKVMRIRNAMFAPCETVSASDSIGKILSSATVGCPPAVPVVMSGERIDSTAAKCFEYYGIEECCVVTE